MYFKVYEFKNGKFIELSSFVKDTAIYKITTRQFTAKTYTVTGKISETDYCILLPYSYTYEEATIKAEELSEIIFGKSFKDEYPEYFL